MFPFKIDFSLKKRIFKLSKNYVIANKICFKEYIFYNTKK